MVVGNEPFTHLAVRDSTGDVFLVKCAKDIRQSLLLNQGKIAELFYTEIHWTNSGTEITVVKVNYLSQKESDRTE